MRRVLFRLFKGVVRIFSGMRLRRFALVDQGYRALFNWLRPEAAHVQGHVLYVDPRDQVIARNLLLYGVWEPFETELFQQQVKPGMVVFCLGAHIGYYALLSARQVGESGRVYAFEPSPESFHLLVRNIEANGYRNVFPVQKAVSNVTGRTRLYLNPRDTGDHRIYPGGEPRSYVGVETVRLDDWVRGREETADLIQMDIQGAELAALEGMDRLVRRSRAVTILTELWPEGLRAFGSSYEAYLKRLSDLGFRIRIIDEDKKSLVPVSGLNDLEPYRTFLNIPNHSLNLLCFREA